MCAAAAAAVAALSLVERAMTAKPQELEAGLVCLKGVALTHKYADPVIVDITIELGGEQWFR
jgi:hypothetical protein